MRVVLLAGVMVAALGVAQAKAYDTFIPLGLGYSTTEGSVSALSASEQQAINQADIYETDIWQRQHRARQFDSKMQRFLNDRNSNGTDTWIDY